MLDVQVIQKELPTRLEPGRSQVMQYLRIR